MSNQEATSDKLSSIILNYRKKAKSLNRRSVFLLLLIFSSLITGILIFIYAGYITASTDNYEKRRILDKLDREISNIYYDYKASQIKNRKSASLKNIEDYKNIYTELINRIEPLLKNDKTEVDYINFFTTLTTRLGSILILIFLVQILTKLYRYSIRLSHYYYARADALEIHHFTPQIDLAALTGMLTPDSYDIGTTKNPTENMTEILKTAIELTRTNKMS